MCNVVFMAMFLCNKFQFFIERSWLTKVVVVAFLRSKMFSFWFINTISVSCVFVLCMQNFFASFFVVFPTLFTYLSRNK
jgi:hypothetical protein